MLLALLTMAMSMNIQSMIGTEAMKGRDGTMKEKDGGTTDGMVTGMMNTPDTGITIDAITGLHITSSGFHVSRVASTWATQMI